MSPIIQLIKRSRRVRVLNRPRYGVLTWLNCLSQLTIFYVHAVRHTRASVFQLHGFFRGLFDFGGAEAEHKPQYSAVTITVSLHICMYAQLF